MRHPDVSSTALDAAAWLAKQSDGQLHCLTVAAPVGTHLTEMPEDHEPDFIAFVERQSERCGKQIEPHFRSHETFEHVLHQEIEKLGIDLVVMSTHPPQLRDYLFGSHSARSLLHNKCSFLVLR